MIVIGIVLTTALVARGDAGVEAIAEAEQAGVGGGEINARLQRGAIARQPPEPGGGRTVAAQDL